MPRPILSHLVAGGLVLLVAGLTGTLLAVVRIAPPIDVPAAGLGWLEPALAWVLVAVAAGAALTWIVGALRSGAVAAALTAGTAAALAGAAVLLVLGVPSPALPILGASAMLLGAVIADRLAPSAVDGSGPRIAVVVTALVAAELLAAAEVLVDAGSPSLLVTAGLAVGAALLGTGRAIAVEAFALAIGAAALGVARAGGLEATIGLASLVATAGFAARRALEAPRGTAIADPADRLPDLAARLADAVLRFDGRLRLADWNATAATLLDLDEESRGRRMEDLLGVPISGLPAHDRIDTVERGVGGLDIAIHRSGGGVIAVIRDPGRAPESERLSRELRGTIEELAQARRTIELQRAEIERGATIDVLTGLPTRTAILDRLRTEVAEASRYRHPVAIVLVDVDGFADLNRRLGTATGDAVLTEVALRLRLRVRTADALGRLSGDCFLAILPHTDAAGAGSFSEALRHRLGAREIVVGRAPIAVTISAGVAVMRAGERVDLDGLLARAEEALAGAKAAGGDRVVLDGLHGLARPEVPPDEVDRAREGGGGV